MTQQGRKPEKCRCHFSPLAGLCFRIFFYQLLDGVLCAVNACTICGEFEVTPMPEKLGDGRLRDE